MALTEKIYYSDISKDLTPHPVTGDISRITNVDAVVESIKNLININKYEVPFKLSKGSNIRNLLFENYNAQTALLAKEYITESIKLEPRAELINIIINPVPLKNAIGITIIVSIVNINDPINIDLLLERI